MRYELDVEGFISKVFFGCHSGNCTLYEGTIPDGFQTLEEWSEKTNIRAYKLVDGNLTYDSVKDAELRALWAAEIENSKISAYISEKGSNANGNWIKYTDGTMIVTQKYQATFSEAESWGSLYAYSITNMKDYPQPFVEIQALNITLESEGKNGWIATNTENGKATMSNPGGYQLVRPTKVTLDAVYVNVIVIGKWK